VRRSDGNGSDQLGGVVPSSTNRFHTLVRDLADKVARHYEEARDHARRHDPQRAGHEGESTWVEILKTWGPNWPVVTRKYIVGPGGESGEVDIVVLKPDYPAQLQDEPSILVSGVAAAFSTKTTLRSEHVVEALEQKRELTEVAGGVGGDVETALCGPFPFGLIAHSTSLDLRAEDWADAFQVRYERVAHSTDPLVTKPSEELDAVLVADKAFLSTSRVALVPQVDPSLPWQPVSSLNRYTVGESERQGLPLALFVYWLNRKLVGPGGSLANLASLFRTESSSGLMTHWSLDVYSEHVREHGRVLLNEYGYPLVY
jgi:hypothetical protein